MAATTFAQLPTGLESGEKRFPRGDRREGSGSERNTNIGPNCEIPLREVVYSSHEPKFGAKAHAGRASS